MSFPRYPAYKDSGVQWIAALPSHWDLRRFKSIFAERIDKSESGDELLLSVSAYTGVTPRSELVDDGDHLSRAESLEGYKRCFKDDLVMNIMLAWNRGLAFTQFEGIVSPAYCVFKVIDGSHPQFLNYLVRSDEYTSYFKAFSSGVIDSRLRIYPETFGSLLCALPPTEEQAGIANFLDHETAKIDALVAEQERLIELLKEKRQAVISHAVTKGLDPSVPMKDLGVEWLGEVPAHWSVRPLKRLARLTTGMTPPTEELENYQEEGFPWIRPEDLDESGAITKATKFLSDMGAGLTRMISSGASLICCIGTIGKVGIVDEVVSTNQQITAAKSFGDDRYFYFSICAARKEMENAATGNVLKILNSERLGEIKLPCPPLGEQGVISTFVDREAAGIDALMAQARLAIALLQERRTALISAAVTGQIDVRGWVPAGTAA